MIHLLPYLECEMRSDRSPEEIYTILSSITDSRKVIFSTDAEFAGQVHPLDFKIIRRQRSYYRNSFFPVIKGNIKKVEEKAAIDIKMQMNPFTRIFLTFWFGVCYFFFLMGIIIMIREGIAGSGTTISLSTAVMIVIVQLVMRSSFHASARRAVERLEELLR